MSSTRRGLAVAAAVAAIVGAGSTIALAGTGGPVVVSTDSHDGVVQTTVTSPGHQGSTVTSAVKTSERTCRSTPAVSPKAGVVQWGEERNGYWGLYYVVSCSDGTVSIDWVAQYPISPSTTGSKQPATLAQRAVDHLPLPSPAVHHNPSRVDGRPETIVGVQTWWWVAPSSFQPITHTVRAGGTWARVTATPTTTYWESGSADAPNVTCDGPGTPYDPRRPASEQHSDCYTVYSRSSADQPQRGPSPNDRYFVAAVTVSWHVTWVGAGGAAGALPTIRRRTTFPIAVGEVQTVNY